MVDQVIEIVRDASKLMFADDFSVTEKDGIENIVTSSDVAVQNFLEKKLTALLPGSDFYGEENDTRKWGGENVWIVDPIDGTTNYSRHMNYSAISVALAKHGEVVLGVVYNPYSGELFRAEKGKGAYLGEKRLHVSGASFKESILCSALSQYRKEYSAVCGEIIMDAFGKCNDVRRFGTASLEISYLAAGRCDLFFEMRLCPWDYAAGGLILTEAGGKIGTYGGAPLRYDRGIPILAANSEENFDILSSIVSGHLPGIPYED